MENDLRKLFIDDKQSLMIFDGMYARYKTGSYRPFFEMIMDNHLGFSKRVNTNNSLFLSELEDRKKCVIFGAGLTGKLAYRYFVRHGLSDKIYAFCDNNKEAQARGICAGREEDDVRVLAVDDIIKSENDATFLIPKGKYMGEMEKQLLEHNVKRSDILFIPYTIIAQNDMDERDDYPEIFNKIEGEKNRIVIFDTDHQADLFNNLMNWSERSDEIACFATATVPSEGALHEGRIVRNIVDVVNDNKEYYYIVFDGIEKTQLKMLGIDNNHILHFANLEGDLQYFDSEINPYNKEKNQESGEIFVDAGSLNLGTSKDFLRWCNGDSKKIYAFEADKRSAKKCMDELKINETVKDIIELIPKGLWSEDKELSFNEVDIPGSSFIKEAKKENGKIVDENVIDVTALDNILQGNPVTLIKMDIEGSELEALKGSQNTILTHKPLLAIAIYHKPEDIYELTKYVHELVPEYKLYLRAYHEDYTEIVLYAMIDV